MVSACSPVALQQLCTVEGVAHVIRGNVVILFPKQKKIYTHKKVTKKKSNIENPNTIYDTLIKKKRFLRKVKKVLKSGNKKENKIGQ